MVLGVKARTVPKCCVVHLPINGVGRIWVGLEGDWGGIWC